MTDELTRVTANFTPRAIEALRAAVELDRLGKTDVLNRAVQVYATLLTEQHVNRAEMLLQYPDGKMERIRFL